MNACFLCKSQAEIEFYPSIRIFHVSCCTTCGDYSITDEAVSNLRYSNEILCKISCFINERSFRNMKPIILFHDTPDVSVLESFTDPVVAIKEAISSYPQKISERIDRILLNLARLSRYSGYWFSISTSDYPVFFCDSQETDALMFIVSYLVNEGLLESKNKAIVFQSNYRLTPKGWSRINEIERQGLQSNTAFVAMWFDPSMVPAWENGFYKAIDANGFNPIRIDQIEHNNDITDEILADIKHSKFVVCDFTGQRGGVYFEAGYALGLGKPVIWTCKKDDFENCHFDTEHRNHIIWETDEELFSKLNNRIRATII
ncbi:MAG: hypothetical protein WAX04_04265 [Oscillospiraceae bacterium]